MGANIQNLRSRMRSVDSTLHLTNAMGLVASSKIRKAQLAMKTSAEYEKEVREITDMLSNCADCKKSPYMQTNDSGKTKLVVIAGDRGLAGGYNANIMRFIRDYGEVDIVAVGKKACEKFVQEINSAEKMTVGEVYEIAKQLCKDYADKKYSKIGVLYTKYLSMLSQEPEIKWLFPIESGNSDKKVSAIFEPNEKEVLDKVVPTYVTGVIYSAIRESFLSEVAARRMAMDSAGKNANAMLEDLQLKYNRARQSSITQEITEIVAGSGE